ncbi:histidine-containing phosphotransfer protein 1-like [Lolium perenne]|uniref:histidine-containing phosphotransfer protein 1-like n=1 Tax=Lolium perenne TaxID=4522 RepID=UPI003A9A2085
MAAAMKLDTLGYEARMFGTGLLDEQFQQQLLLPDGSKQNFVAEIVTLFSQEGERIIGELAKDKPCVNFNEVAAYVHKLEGSGAWCLKTLDTMRVVFYDLCGKFKAMLQLEQQQAEATT